ncbi:MAG: AmmeMemoRadiSam system protein B [Bacteroidales bacterium]|nr:AmmeMemoRadiSam system protein B [Bacteroidales bacterium]
MRIVLVVLFSIFTIMETYSQNNSTDRQPVAAGRFYSADKEILIKDINLLFEKCKKPDVPGYVRAIISPHAGYIFSGNTAAAALSAIPKSTIYKNIFIIGSSHVMAFDGASVYNTGDYITPLGKAVVNKEIGNKLIKENSVFNFPVKSHISEHSIEVQIPLIQSYFTNLPPIIPIIIGTDNEKTIKQIAEALRPWFTNENLFIISSDFSHYPSYKDAVETDKATAHGIASGNPKTFLTSLQKNSEKQINGLATSMCGWSSGLTLLYLSEKNTSLQYKIIDYTNSGDSSYGSKDEVVGYNAIVLFDNNQKKEKTGNIQESFSFTEKEKEILFSIAGNSIKSGFSGKNESRIDAGKIPDHLKEPMGAFVTLKIEGRLRGCIGRFISKDPLYEAVRASAFSSAFEDPRFSPLTSEELGVAEMEITVLGPLKRINKPEEIILGRHGIYIRKDSRSGTMLPQVATENGWSIEEFLGYTSRDKAGLGWDGWRDAELFIYEGVVLEEKRK